MTGRGGAGQRWATPGPGDGRGLPGGWLGQAGPFLLLALAAGWLAVHYGEIPDPLVTHWNLHFEPDGWSAKSLPVVFGVPAFGAVLCAIMVLVSLGLLYRARPVEGGEEARAAEWRRRYASLQILLMANYLIALLDAVVSLFPLAQTPARVRVLLGVAAVLGVAGPLAFLLWIGVRVAPLYLGKGPGRGPGSLRRAAADGKAGGEEHWKLGLAYYNPDDPAIFVEKHLGIGYTLNFARREVWLFLALLLAAPVLLLAWMLS